MRITFLMAGLALLISGCMTYDPYTEEEKVSNATKGAAIGAGIAALAAAISNRDEDSRDRNQRVMAAAAAGGAIGGGVGYYMDRQEARLRAQLRNSGVRIIRDGENIVLVMPGNITFATDSSDIRSEFLDVLGSVSTVLTEFDRTLVEIGGHTDSTGSNSYNQALSERRARAVANSLVVNQIDSSRLLIIGYGETRPIADNSTTDGRQLNRRVEILLVPVTG